MASGPSAAAIIWRAIPVIPAEWEAAAIWVVVSAAAVVAVWAVAAAVVRVVEVEWAVVGCVWAEAVDAEDGAAAARTSPNTGSI